MGSICVPSYANIFMPEFEEYHRRHFYGMDQIPKWIKTLYERNKSKTIVKQIWF